MFGLRAALALAPPGFTGHPLERGPHLLAQLVHAPLQIGAVQESLELVSFSDALPYEATPQRLGVARRRWVGSNQRTDFGLHRQLAAWQIELALHAHAYSGLGGEPAIELEAVR